MNFIDGYKGYITFSRFNGVKAGRSVWKQITLTTAAYVLLDDCRSYVRHLIDDVLPATGVKIIEFHIESCLIPQKDIDDAYKFPTLRSDLLDDINEYDFDNEY